MGVYELSGAGSLKTGRTLYPTMNANNGNSYGAMVPIASVVVPNDNGGEYAFSNIPQIYQDLMIVVNVRGVTNAGFGYLYLNAFGSDQSFTALTGNGTSAISTRGTSNSVIQWIPNTDLLSSTTPYSATFHILNYANTSTKKTIIGRSSYDKNGSGGTQLIAGTYNIAGPVTLVSFATFSGGAFFATGSTFTLYGIRAVAS